MTDQSGPSTGRHRPRRPPRLGDSRAPITTVAVLAAAAIAVAAGFLILRSITDQTAESGDVVSDAAVTTITTVPQATTGPSPNTTTTTTTTTVPLVSKSDAIVVVANASGIGGSATDMTAQLAADGYTTAPVANSTGERLALSIIYFVEGDPASFAVARLLAEQIPTAQTLPMPAQPPLDRPLNRATVVLLLGTDAAGRPLAEPTG